MPLPDRSDRAKALARTYGGDRDGWDRVHKYRRAMAYHEAHPDQRSAAAAVALDLPRVRIHPWFDGGKPNPAHAVRTAEQLCKSVL